MIGRLLLILGIFLFVWMGYRFLKKTLDEGSDNIESEESDTPKMIQEIKACAYCKTHIPEDEGIIEGEKFFCSYEHLNSYIKHKSE